MSSNATDHRKPLRTEAVEYPALQKHCNDADDETEEDSDAHETCVPVMVCGDGREAEEHEDDCLAGLREHLKEKSFDNGPVIKNVLFLCIL